LHGVFRLKVVAQRNKDTILNQKKSQPHGQVVGKHYLAEPEIPTGKGVLVLHAWWGLTPFFKGFCDRLAGEGFTVLAPDLYHGETAATIEEATNLRDKLDAHIAAQEITQAVEVLQTACGSNKAGIGVVGFSLGGSWALWLAGQKASPVIATVVFYDAERGDYTQCQSAFQFHFAETDEYTPASEVQELQECLRAAGREVEYYTYPGTGHWFFENDRPDAYRVQAAELAWNHTLAFLKQHIPQG
jgi:carboxymethylenebutenolidase